MKVTKWFIVVAGLLVLIFAGTLIVNFLYRFPKDVGEQSVTIVIEQGDSFSRVANELTDKGVVRWRLLLKVYAKLRGVDRHLTPGRYDFAGENSIKLVLDRLAAADFYRVRVTVPEGSTIWKVASILQQEMEFDSAQVVALNSDSAFLDSLELPSLEGFLFPTTYFFPWGSEMRPTVRDMVHQFRLQTDSIWPSEIILGLSQYQILTLASIVEAETSLDSERTTVASVYVNRLRDNMRLDADPTVIYGLGGLTRPLYRKDLRKKTPYNTYIHKGLPPTPINSPGLASIQAALHPESTDYFFFVADDSGGHHFSKTFAEHNRAIREIRSRRNESNRQ